MDERGSEAPAEPEAERHQSSAKGPRWRRITSWVLVVLACLLGRGLGPGGVRPEPTAEHRRLREDDGTAGHQPGHPDPGGHPGERRTHRPHRSEPAGQGRLTAQGRISGDARSRSEVQNATYYVTLKAVQSPKFEQLWVTVNRAASKQLAAVLTGSSEGSVSTKNGKITIDLSKVEANVKRSSTPKGLPSSTRCRRPRDSTTCCSSRRTWSASRS